MNQAIGAYRSITASPEFQEIERLREKASHDEAQALHNVRMGIAQNMLKRDRPIDEIIEDTGLSREVLEALRND